MIMRKKS